MSTQTVKGDKQAVRTLHHSFNNPCGHSPDPTTAPTSRQQEVCHTWTRQHNKESIVCISTEIP